MKHAGWRALQILEPVLRELRRVPGLTERKPGIFYRGSVAFLHFHEDEAGIFADVKEGKEFARYPVKTPADQKRLLRTINP